MQRYVPGLPSSQGTDAAAASFATLEQAAEWFAVLRSGHVSQADQARWQAWHAAHAEHRQAWQRVQAISGRMTLPPDTPREQRAAAESALGSAARAMRRRQALKALSAVGGLCAIGWMASRVAPVHRLMSAWQADHRTATGETRELVLPEGTRATLNTDSALDVHYGDHLRRIVLRQGEVFIDTAPDASNLQRPFVVDTTEGRLRALGTRFNVRLRGGATQLAIFEGRVEVSPTASPARIFSAGQQVRFTADEIDLPEAAEPNRQAWSRGVLLADDMPLAAFVEELSRYRPGHLACDPAVANLRVVGGYPLANTDQALAMLQAALPVRVHATMPWWVTVRAR